MLRDSKVTDSDSVRGRTNDVQRCLNAAPTACSSSLKQGKGYHTMTGLTTLPLLASAKASSISSGLYVVTSFEGANSDFNQRSDYD